MEAIVIQDIVIKFDEFVAEENILIQRIGVCKEFIEVILKYVSDRADSIHILTVEDIVTAVHRIGQDLDTELLHIRLEKHVLESKMKSYQTENRGNLQDTELLHLRLEKGILDNKLKGLMD